MKGTNNMNILTSLTKPDLSSEIEKVIHQLIWTLAFDVDPDQPGKLEGVAAETYPGTTGTYRDKLRSLVEEMVAKADAA
jgi:hypothetical protein